MGRGLAVPMPRPGPSAAVHGSATITTLLTGLFSLFLCLTSGFSLTLTYDDIGAAAKSEASSSSPGRSNLPSIADASFGPQTIRSGGKLYHYTSANPDDILATEGAGDLVRGARALERADDAIDTFRAFERADDAGDVLRAGSRIDLPRRPGGRGTEGAASAAWHRDECPTNGAAEPL